MCCFTSNCVYSQTEIKISADLLDSRFVEGEIDPAVLKNYNIVKLELQNKTDEIIFLPASIFFTDSNNIKYRAESPQLIFKKLQRHPVRRATIISIPVTIISMGILTIPAFVASCVYSSNYNTKLLSGLQRNSYHSTAVADSDTYKIYVLIPKKYKEPKKLIIENIKTENGTPITLETFIGKEDY